MPTRKTDIYIRLLARFKEWLNEGSIERRSSVYNVIVFFVKKGLIDKSRLSAFLDGGK